jgi:phosphatidylethanolamine-binding protein (PEBP) family uncharacterized protein
MLVVTYDTVIHNVKKLTLRETTYEPTVIINTHYDTYFTIIMIDPDVSCPDYLHWLVINIKGISKHIIIPYEPPKRTSSTHRYVFYLYEQQYKFKYDLSIPYIIRRGFSINTFIKDNNLKFIECVYFKIKSNRYALL